MDTETIIATAAEPAESVVEETVRVVDIPSGCGVYVAISAVQRAIAKEGITKSRRNLQQGYTFRGIDDVYNALSSLLGEYGLCIIPRYITRAIEERKAKSGDPLFNVVVEGEFHLVAASDGSSHMARTFGEAMDSADKATNKAMSAAYKAMAFQLFAIPTAGDNDADLITHQVAAGLQQPSAPAPRYNVAQRQPELPKTEDMKKPAQEPKPERAKGEYASEREEFKALWQRLAADLGIPPTSRGTTLQAYLSGYFNGGEVPKDPVKNITALKLLDRTFLENSDRIKERIATDPKAVGRMLGTASTDQQPYPD